MIRLLPEGMKGNQFSIEAEDNTVLSALFTDLGVSDDDRLLTILNGSIVTPENYTGTLLSDGDQLSLMPPIVAG